MGREGRPLERRGCTSLCCLMYLARCVGDSVSVSGDIWWWQVKVTDPRFVLFVANVGCGQVSEG